MIETVEFGDLVLSDFGEVIDVQRTMAGIEPTVEAVSGRDGDALRGVRLTQPEVSVLLVARFSGMQLRRRLVRELSPRLLSKEFQRLAFASDEGLYYKAVLAERPDLSEFVNAGTLRLKFLVDGSAMYGKTRTKSMTTTTTIEVGGTYPTPLKISGTASPSNGHLSVSMDGMDFVKVPMSGSATVEIDCGRRTCKVAGVTKQVTLDSDWLVPDAGSHTLAFASGSGTLTVEWTERWL